MSNSNPPRVYIGWDQREESAYRVAEHSLRRRASGPLVVTPLQLHKLEQWGMVNRMIHHEGGQMVDVISEAPMSTEFAISRFITPLLAQTGWSLFVDCDMLFLGDVYELFTLADPKYAAMCVKHEHTPATLVKMDSQIQTRYPRKNWSSVVLWNSDHPANANLHMQMLSEKTGRWLHGFSWLADSEIGDLPMEWNWLVGVQSMPLHPKLAHYTLGTPDIPGYEKAAHADLWWEEHFNLTGKRAP